MADKYNLRSQKTTTRQNDQEQFNQVLFGENTGHLQTINDNYSSSNDESAVSAPEIENINVFATKTDVEPKTRSESQENDAMLNKLSSAPSPLRKDIDRTTNITETRFPIELQVDHDNRLIMERILTTDIGKQQPILSDLATQTRLATAATTSLISDPFEQLAKLIQSSHLSINAKIENQKLELKTDIQNQLENHSATLKAEIQHNYTLINTKMTEISKEQEYLKTEITELKHLYQNLSKEVEAINTQIDTRFEQRETNIREHLIKDLIEQKEEINQTIIVENMKTQSKLQEQIYQVKNETNKNIEAIRNENYEQIDLVSTKIKQMRSEIIPNINSNKTQIDELKESVQSCQNQISNIGLPHNCNTQPLQNPISVNVVCNGKTQIPEMTSPKFNGKTYNAQEFLSKLKRCYEKQTQNLTYNSTEILSDLIENSLEGHALKWYYLIKNNIRTLEDFEKAFHAKFWNHEIQRGVKQRIEQGWYRTSGKLTRSEYFIEKVLTLKSLNPPLSDDEIIICLSDHFGSMIQGACRVQNIRTIEDFEALLQREDLTQQTRSSNNKYKSNSPHDEHQNPHQRHKYEPYRHNNQREINHQAYTPKYFDNGSQNHYNNRNERYNPYRPPHNQKPDKPPYQQSPYRNQPKDDRRYPTNEQKRVCTTVVDGSVNRPNDNQECGPYPITEMKKY